MKKYKNTLFMLLFVASCLIAKNSLASTTYNCHSASDCDDGDGCTVDTCEWDMGFYNCNNKFDSGLPGCGDEEDLPELPPGYECTTAEHCGDDGNECTSSFCAWSSHTCHYGNLGASTPCNNGAGHCDGNGGCVNNPPIDPPSMGGAFCDAFTKKISIDWYNFGRTNGETYVKINNDEIKVPSNIINYEYQGSDAGVYDVSVIYKENGQVSQSSSKTASCFSCMGAIPEGSEVCGTVACRGDANVTSNTKITLADSCGSSKCQYVCKEGLYKDVDKCSEYNNKPSVTLRVRDAGSFDVGETVTLLYSVNPGCSGIECTKKAASRCDLIVSGPENGTKAVPYQNSNYNVGMVHYETGTYSYTLKCSNSYGEGTASASAKVEGTVGGGGPVATILSPEEDTRVMAGKEVVFTGAGAGEGGIYEWCNGASCGCGSILLSKSSSNKVTRTFHEPAYGWNRTALRVTDAQGRVSTNNESVGVTVTANPICHNGVRDNDEFGVDCGGSICSLCNVDLSGALNLDVFCDKNGAMEISWEIISNADRYDLRIKERVAGLVAPPNLQKELTGHTYNWSGVPDKAYYVGVGAIAENGQVDIYGEREVVTIVCDGSGMDDDGDVDVLSATINSPSKTTQYIKTGDSINFSGAGTDTSGKNITNYEWRVNNCSSGDLIGNSSSFDKNFSTIGNYRVFLRVQNQDGAWSDNCPSRAVNVSENTSCSNEGEECGSEKLCCSELLCNNRGVCEKEEYRGEDPIKFRR